MTMLSKVISATGLAIDTLSTGAARLIGLRCLSSGTAALTLQDSDGNDVVVIDSYTAPSVGNVFDIPPATSERIFAKNVFQNWERDLPYNGNFDGDYGWTKGTGWSISGGVATISAPGASSDLYQDSADFVDGDWYLLTFTMTRTAGSLTPYLNGQALTVRSASGTYSEWVQAGSTGNRLTFQAGATFAGTVDAVSIKRATDPSDLLACSSVTGTWQATYELA